MVGGTSCLRSVVRPVAQKGNGECEAGKCRCFAGWEGDRCQCSLSLQKHCMNANGQICNGRGRCVCGKCWCTDPSSLGRLCEFCPNCRTPCSDKRNCVSCHSNSSQMTFDQCKTSCAYRLHHAEQSVECLSDDPSHFRIFSIIFIVTFLIGLLNVLIIRQIILQWINYKIKSSADYRGSAKKNDNAFLPTVCTKTVTYRRNNPEDININTSKLQGNETFRCNS